MSTYTLTAQLDSLFEVTSIEAKTEQDATEKAVSTIIVKASHTGNPTATQRLWARGTIVFRNPQGEPLHTLREVSA